MRLKIIHSLWEVNKNIYVLLRFAHPNITYFWTNLINKQLRLERDEIHTNQLQLLVSAWKKITTQLTTFKNGLIYLNTTIISSGGAIWKIMRWGSVSLQTWLLVRRGKHFVSEDKLGGIQGQENRQKQVGQMEFCFGQKIPGYICVCIV
jgi:hypothetical protein